MANPSREAERRVCAPHIGAAYYPGNLRDSIAGKAAAGIRVV
jgi:hypothetical protein